MFPLYHNKLREIKLVVVVVIVVVGNDHHYDATTGQLPFVQTGRPSCKCNTSVLPIKLTIWLQAALSHFKLTGE